MISKFVRVLFGHVHTHRWTIRWDEMRWDKLYFVLVLQMNKKALAVLKLKLFPDKFKKQKS